VSPAYKNPVPAISRIHFLAGLEKPMFFKKMPSPLAFGGFIGFLGFVGFWNFYLNEQLESLLVDLAHQLSFYLDSSLL